MKKEKAHILRGIIKNLKDIYSGLCMEYGYESDYHTEEDTAYWILSEDSLPELEKMIEELESL